MTDVVERAQWIAETVFQPDAQEVDARGTIPASHFRVLASEGLYGLVVPDAGVGFDTAVEVIETLAGGCLPTTFTWLQHHLAVVSLANTANAALRAEFFTDLVAGTKTSGVATAGALAEPPRLRATKTDGGWIFDGDAPFVSGWGLIDVLQIAGNTGETVVNALLDARNIPSTKHELVALDATATVRLRFDKVFVPDTRIISEIQVEELRAVQQLGARLSGALPVGLALRCARILESFGRTEAAAAIDARVTDVRATLDAALAAPDTMWAARAAAANLAYEAAGAVFVAEGAGALLAGGQGQRLVREALFTFVTGSRVPMKDALVEILTS